MESFDWKTEKVKLLPDGEYCLHVSEPKGRMSKNGDPQVMYTPIVYGGEYHGRVLPRQFVTFIKAGQPGAGMAIKFLKSIGEPYEGSYKVVPANWDTKKFKAFVVAGEYKGEPQNSIKWVDTWEGDFPAVPAASQQEDAPEDVPF